MIEKICSAPIGAAARSLVNKYQGKRLAILAGAKCVWDDYGVFTIHHAGPHDVMCVNDIGMFFPHLEHWFSLHGKQLHGWSDVRAFHHPRAQYLHSTQEVSGVIQWPVPSSGTSTLSAVYVGLILGYAQIVLCGAPLDNSPHFFDPAWGATNFANESRHDVWERANSTIFEGKVKSMSGISRELLGSP